MSPAPEDRIAAAETRAMDALRKTRRLADRLSEEIDDITDVGSRPNVEIHDEDSAVIVLDAAIAQSKKVAIG